jgi:phage-related protein
MPLTTFAPSVGPSPGTTMKPDVSLNEVSFGDGYTLASPNGINHIRHKISLRWDGLTQAQHDELRAFFLALKGNQPFYYTHAGDGVLRKWTCKDWSSTLGVPLKFTADLVENFSLTT